MIAEKTVYQGKYLRLMTATYSDASGRLREWEFVERTNCDGIVAIVPVTDDDEILLIRQFRPPVNRCVIEFPAGLNDKGGTLEEAARRELLEETGYAAKTWELLTEGPLSSGASGEILTVYLARGLEFSGAGTRDETEDIEVMKIPMDSLHDRLAELQARGDFVDLKILGLLEIAKGKIGR